MSGTDAELIEIMSRAMDTPEGQEYMPVMREFAARALAAINAAGYALVPIKPTEAMIAAGLEADMAGFNGPTTPVAHIWTAMLSANAAFSPTDGADSATGKGQAVNTPSQEKRR